MGIVFLLIVGAAAGFLATRFMGLQLDVPTTIVLGMGGALMGGLLLRLLVGMLGMAAGLVGAVLGAMTLVWLWQTFIGR